MITFLVGFLGEVLPWNSTNTSVVKTHGRKKGVSFDTAVVLIRDPYNALVAEYNRMAGGHVGVAEPEYFKINGENYPFVLGDNLTAGQ